MSAAFSKCSQNKKNGSAQGSLKFREVSNSFWEGTRREKTRLKKVSYLFTYILSQSEQNMYFYTWFYCAFYKFSEVQIMHIQVERGTSSAVPLVFGCTSSGSRCGNVPNELIHRAGPPFLDNHYRGYQ